MGKNYLVLFFRSCCLLTHYQIVVDLVRCVPQLAGWHARRAMTALDLEDVYDHADPLIERSRMRA